MKINFNFEEKNVKLGLENQFTIQEFLEVTPVKILMLKGEKGDTVSAEWGSITGNIEDQTDLASKLDTKADKSTTYTKTEVDTALDLKADTTDIPDVSNFITKEVNNLTNYTKTSDLSEVATSGDYDDLDNKPTLFSGSYNDLTDKPSIPSKTSDLTNNSGFIDNTVNNLTNYTKTSDLSDVATSGDYTDLDNKPTIPTNSSIVDLIYPVGAIYMSVNSTSPATLFGGTWERIKDQFLLSAGDTYGANTTGGSASHKITSAELPKHTHTYSKSNTSTGSHTLTVDEIPSHTHSAGTNSNGFFAHATAGSGFGAGFNNVSAGEMGWYRQPSNTGGGQGHSHSITLSNANTGDGGFANNSFSTLPPYLAVYVWKRTA